MADDLRVNGWLVIPAGELHERFSRSSGPGGQSVNTADTRVELSFDIAHSAALPEYARERALSQLAGRLTDGVLTVVASEQRSQLLNRRAARGRLANLLREAIAPPHGPAFPPVPAAPRASAGWPTNGAAARSSGPAAPIPATPNDRRARSRAVSRPFPLAHASAGSRVSDTELMHQRWSVGTSYPSPSNTWPRCESQRAQRTSVRFIPSVRSSISVTASSLVGW